MGDVVMMPLSADAAVVSAALPDVRGDHRALQVTWHERDDVFVVSMWRDGRCHGTVRLAPADAAVLIASLAEGLAQRG